jgi:hypothetical protein
VILAGGGWLEGEVFTAAIPPGGVTLAGGIEEIGLEGGSEPGVAIATMPP